MIWWPAAGVAWAATPPSNSVLPTISGVAQQGNQLTANPGTWSGDTPITFSYQWSDGQTGSTDTVAAADVGQSLSVTVTATNDAGQASATSATAGPVLPAPPSVLTAPSITGTARQGKTLTASTGAWSNSPTAYSYAWADCTSASAGCSSIAGATSSTYKLVAADVAKYVNVTVTASNSAGHGSVASAAVGPILPPAPSNTTAPAITGTAEQGDTLIVTNGTWDGSPSAYTYAWEDCNSAGGSCAPIRGATSSSYTLSAADIGSTIACVVTAKGAGGTGSASSNTTAVVAAAPTPPASQPTTTALLASPGSAVTNEAVTLIATVTSGSSSSTALWGAVTFADDGSAITGCANLPVTPSGQSATVACSTSFGASTAQLTATFTASTGSVLEGSASRGYSMVVGRDSTSTSLDVSSSVNVGAGTTYTASVGPPAARPGPIEPTGSVEFLDAGQPISSCAGRPLNAGVATCTVTYAAAGVHQISARYGGDANFAGSSSPTELVSAALHPPPVAGTIASTMQWAFYYTPKYTQVRNLAVNGVSAGATVLVGCRGGGCPFGQRAASLSTRALCGRKARMCLMGGSFRITPGFASRRLAVGARITVEITRPHWVGKYYRFTIRSRQAPRVLISCLAPGASVPGQGC